MIYSTHISTCHYTPSPPSEYLIPRIFESLSVRLPPCLAASPECPGAGAGVSSSGICSSVGGWIQIRFFLADVPYVSPGIFPPGIHVLQASTSSRHPRLPGILFLWASPPLGIVILRASSSSGHLWDHCREIIGFSRVSSNLTGVTKWLGVEWLKTRTGTKSYIDLFNSQERLPKKKKNGQFFFPPTMILSLSGGKKDRWSSATLWST